MFDDNEELTARGLYQQEVSQKLKDLWKDEDSVEKKWEAMRTALCESAESILGLASRRYLDWFLDSKVNLKPLFEQRNPLCQKWLSTGRSCDLETFKEVRKRAKRMVREAIDSWFQQKADTAQAGRFSGKLV